LDAKFEQLNSDRVIILLFHHAPYITLLQQLILSKSSPSQDHQHQDMFRCPLWHQEGEDKPEDLNVTKRTVPVSIDLCF